MSDRLFLVRHGVTAWNREGRFQGHRDPPLAAEGRREARLLGDRLRRGGAMPARIISSSLARATQTAELIASRGDDAAKVVAIETDARLIEIGQGAWEGRTHAELRRDEAARYAAWRARREGFEAPPAAEPIEAALARVVAAAEEALRATRTWPLCIVGHGGSLRLLVRHLLGLSARRSWALDLDNASLSVLERDGSDWRIERWNDTLHLLGVTSVHVDELEGEPLAL